MLCGTIIQQALLITIAIIYLKQTLYDEILIFKPFHIAMMANIPLLVALKQAYFILSLKKVRIWL